MIIKVLGSGCKRCMDLTNNARTALAELGIDCQVEKVNDLAEIARYGVMSTPALVIDDRVVSSGKVLKPREITRAIQDAIA